MTNILVTLPVNERQRALIEAAAPGAHFAYVPIPQVSADDTRTADVILGNAPAQTLSACTQLKWMQLNSAGADAYLKPGVLPEGMQLTNATGAYGLAISEHMLGALLTMMKHLDFYAVNRASHSWTDGGKVRSVYGSSALVVGLGDIGGEFASRLNALGCTVTGVRRHAAPCPDYLHALATSEQLDELLPEADIVAVTLPGTDETRGMFGAERFARMKPGAYFLNVGRGSIVDSMALADALNSGRLAGASIDVTDPEPLPPEHPLWDAKNLLLTPHVSGGYHLDETFERIVRIAADNLRRFTAGEQLVNVVDRATGYRTFRG